LAFGDNGRRAVELRPVEAGRHPTDFVPMCACFLREGQGEATRTLTVVLGAETIRGVLGSNAHKDAVRNLATHNLTLVENMAIRAGRLMLYLSLCRFQDNSFTRGLLDARATGLRGQGGEGRRRRSDGRTGAHRKRPHR
jgi:hypothetical protein